MPKVKRRRGLFQGDYDRTAKQLERFLGAFPMYVYHHPEDPFSLVKADYPGAVKEYTGQYCARLAQSPDKKIKFATDSSHNAYGDEWGLPFRLSASKI